MHANMRTFPAFYVFSVVALFFLIRAGLNFDNSKVFWRSIIYSITASVLNTIAPIIKY